MLFYDPIGKTLVQIARDIPEHYRDAFSVFILQDENDTTGKEVETSYSVMSILRKHPEIADFKVKLENDFFGTTVLRVIKE